MEASAFFFEWREFATKPRFDIKKLQNSHHPIGNLLHPPFLFDYYSTPPWRIIFHHYEVEYQSHIHEFSP